MNYLTLHEVLKNILKIIFREDLREKFQFFIILSALSFIPYVYCM